MVWGRGFWTCSLNGWPGWDWLPPLAGTAPTPRMSWPRSARPQPPGVRRGDAGSTRRGRRSSTTTDFPALASRYAATAPPKPEPITTTSTCSRTGVRRVVSGRLPLEEVENMGKYVDMCSFADDGVQEAVAGSHVQLVP